MSSDCTNPATIIASTLSAKMAFSMPTMDINASGWGPTAGVSAAKFNNIPFAPFCKGDRLGRAADWVNASRPGTSSFAFDAGCLHRAYRGP